MKILHVFSCVLLGALIGAPAPPQTVDPARVAVAAVGEAIIAADNARDLAGVMACYDEQATLWPPNESPVSGHAAIRPRYEALFAASNPELRNRTDRISVSGDLAVVEGETSGRFLSRTGAPERRVHDRYLMVLARREGKWKIVQLVWKPVP